MVQPLLDCFSRVLRPQVREYARCTSGRPKRSSISTKCSANALAVVARGRHNMYLLETSLTENATVHLTIQENTAGTAKRFVSTTGIEGIEKFFHIAFQKFLGAS